MEVGTVFTEGKFRTFIQLITRRRSLSPSSYTCTVLYSPHGEPTFKYEGAIQAYHVPREQQGGLGAAYIPEEQHPCAHR